MKRKEKEQYRKPRMTIHDSLDKITEGEPANSQPPGTIG
jgi:hypothetical protein